MKENTIIYFIIGVVWFFNINDLIRGGWFYTSVSSIVFWNILAIMFFIILMVVKDLNK